MRQIKAKPGIPLEYLTVINAHIDGLPCGVAYMGKVSPYSIFYHFKGTWWMCTYNEYEDHFKLFVTVAEKLGIPIADMMKKETLKDQGLFPVSLTFSLCNYCIDEDVCPIRPLSRVVAECNLFNPTYEDHE